MGLNRRLRGRVRYPIVAIVHHLRCSEARPAWQNRVYGWVEQYYLRGVDGFVFNSRTTQSTVAAWAGLGRPGGAWAVNGVSAQKLRGEAA